MPVPAAVIAGRSQARIRPVSRAPGRSREIRTAYILMAPALLLVLGAIAYPLGWEIWTSLTDFSARAGAPPAFVGPANYRTLARDPLFWRALTVTVLYVAVTSAAKLALGLGLALLLARPFPGRALVFLAVFLPWAYPGAVTVIAWYWMLNPPLTTSYSAVAGNIKYVVDGWLGSGAYAFSSVMLFNVWRGGSFTAVLLLAGLGAIPTELFDSARIDAPSVWRRFRHVTLPLLRPFVALAVFLTFTMAVADLANVWMLTGGRIVFPLIGTQAYSLAIQSGEFGQAAARSLSLVPLLAVVLLILFRWLDPGEARA